MMEQSDWDLTQKIVRNDKDVMATPVDTDLVLMSIERGRYYGTSVVGSRIWELLENSITGKEICEKLLLEFKVEQDTCEAEVTTFLKQLNNESLIQLAV